MTSRREPLDKAPGQAVFSVMPAGEGWFAGDGA